MKKLFIIFILLFITSCSYIEDIKKDITGEVIYEKIPIDSGNISVYFCPRDNCEEKMIDLVESSEKIHCNYEDEFQSFMRNEFGRDATVENPKVILNNEILIENYFCPEDNCEQHVYDVISKARQKIYFMTFSFTSDKLGDLIIEKSNEVEVKGIFENFQSSTQYSELNKMKNLNVITDENPAFMHHKVFVVDDIVVLGSYNPTSSGNSKNDENILIIYDEETANKFIEEFDYIWNL